MPDLERALELRPNHYAAQYARMQCFTAANRIEEASVIAEQLLDSPLVESTW